MRQVLNDYEQEKQFHRDGFVTLNLLNEVEFNQLTKIVDELNKAHIEYSVEANSEYKLSFFNNDLEFKQRVFRTLSDFFQPIIDKHLKNYKPLIINVFDKEPGGGEVPMHQNWTFVDETQFTSVSVWIPLIDVSRKNGALEVVKGSHKVLCQYRSPSLMWVFDELNDILKEKYMEPFELVKGQAAILDDGILHYSSENDTDVTRTTVQLIMIPDDATPIHYVKKNDTVDIYEVDTQFFMQYDMKNLPEGYQVIGNEDVQLEKMSEETFVNVVAQNNPSILKKYRSRKKVSLLDKIFGK
ncbi:MAG: phytanoyl-CoA dioxygenase family protein [Chitinophagales bacterium]|nr:phytanoyl-CoA dioxygenase family protein [Chitinophagales bacterium]